MSRFERGVPIWFYAGGALGPFAGGIIGAILPALRASFGADLALASWTVPAYMAPFAVFQLVSGAFSDRVSRRVALGIGFSLYTLASLVCAIAPGMEWFIAGRALQGAANAFTTPILIAATADLVPRERLGRALGAFVSVNMIGGFAAPLVGGVGAEIDWRYVYVVTALISLVLGILYDHILAGQPRRAHGTATPLGQLLASALDRRGLLVGLAAFLAQVGTFGSSYLWSTYLVDRWQLDLWLAGVISSALGLTGILAAPIAGRQCDRHGPIPVLMASAVLAALAGVGLAFAPTPWVFFIFTILLGAGYGAVWAAMPNLVLSVLPDPRVRGTAISINATFRFGSSAISPAFFTPVYAGFGGGVFLVATLSATLLLGLVALVPRSAPRRT
ncbi:MAG: MFS transporter [Chloroflexota bacterium]|nr:MAG: MFS transporter [Chloroflexota bacterium]